MMDFDAKPGFVHVAGAYSGGVQHCVICGGVLVDHRGSVQIAGGGGRPGGFPEGPVTKQGNCTSVGAHDDLPECEPSFEGVA